MRRLVEFLLLGLIFLLPGWAVQEKSPQAPPSPPSPKAQGKPQPPTQDADAPPAPASAEEDLEVATFYIHKGDPDAAIPRLEEAIRFKPKLAKPYLLLAEVYEKKGDAADAVKYYTEYVRVFPSAPDSKKVQRKIERLKRP